MARFNPSVFLLAAAIILSNEFSSPVACLAAEPAEAKTVRVAAVQFVSEFGQPAENRKGLEPLVREAAKNGAKIIVLPEAAIPGYMSHDMHQTWQVEDHPLTETLQGSPAKSVAEAVPGPSTDAFGLLAKELGIYLTVPLLEIDAKQNKFFNTLVLLDPDGKIVLHYRKIHPYPWAEKGWASPGDRGHQYVDTPYGRLGLLVCFDIHFEPPTLKVNHVDHLLYSIAWVDYADSKWFTEALPGIATKTNVNIIAANWSVSKQPAWIGYGHSEILARDGRILAKNKKDLGHDILYADRPVRRGWDYSNSGRTHSPRFWAGTS